MEMNLSYKEIAYLLGCYVIIADNEINQIELDVLENYMQLSKEDELFSVKQAIFSNAEGTISENDLLYKLKLGTFTESEKDEILKLLVQIAYSDDYVSIKEQKLLVKVSEILNYPINEIQNKEAQLSEERVNKGRLSNFKRAVGNVENILYDTFADKNKVKNLDFLFGSLAYSVVLENITETAKTDLNRVSNIMKVVNHNLQEINEDISKIKIIKANSSKEVQQVAETVTKTSQRFKELIDSFLDNNVEVIEKKSRNIRYFTLAFMGRTKAGKSTMHKLMTQQETDDIGIGSLRTTRYNRSWYWDRLRIIDTPGIGAPGGDVDTEIAKSIIDEADSICYIVTSDSIQETEFDFFETIKERNKPLYIILNVKTNLTQPIRLKRFLEDPKAWRINDGNQSISGHIERIHDRLDGKYNMNAVQIIPIHLLAAQIGFSGEKDKDVSNILIEGSNIMEFIRALKKEVHSSGTLKKSLSIIDGTAFQINNALNIILEEYWQLHDALEMLTQERSKFKSMIFSELDRLLKDIELIFKITQEELYNRASTFADSNYDNEEAGEQWAEDMVVKNIQGKLNNKITARIDDLKMKVISTIKEMSEDIASYDISNTMSSNAKGVSVTNVRLGVGILGSLFTSSVPFIVPLLISNPAGWLVAGITVVVGLVVSIITSLFSSKSTKIKKAQEKMREQLNKNIDNFIKSNKAEVDKNIKENIERIYKTVDDIFDTYITNINSILYKISDLYYKCEASENAINSLIGLRVLEYVGKQILQDKKIDNIENDELYSEYPIKRDWKQQSIEYLYPIKLKDTQIQKAERATQMRILINSKQ